MSGGHWQYSGWKLQHTLERIAGDETVKARWPRIAQLFDAMAPILFEWRHEMDWDISSDSHIGDDDGFETRVCHSILEAAMRVASDRLFPRGKWATIQAV